MAERTIDRYRRVIVLGEGDLAQRIIDIIPVIYKEMTVLPASINSTQHSLDEMLGLYGRFWSRTNRRSLWIVADDDFTEEHLKLLKKARIKKADIKVYGVRDVERLERDGDIIKKTTPLKMIQFETDISDHCNLNCKHCSVFCPVTKERFYDFDQYSKDIHRMGLLFNRQAVYVNLIGGEPLLNKNICQYMIVLGEEFPDAWLNIYTNGLLLYGMNDDFWDTCRKYKFHILITQYPIGADYAKMRKYVEDKGVEFHICNEKESLFDHDYVRVKMSRLPVDPEGKQDAMESFRGCWEPNRCIKLRDGKLYTCVRAAVINRFNEAFGMDIPTTEADYVDIYKAQSAEEVFKKLASGPIPLCKYCDMRGRDSQYPWSQSGGTIDEWIYTK